MNEIYIPQRVKDVNAQIAAQGNKGYSVSPSELYSPTVFTDSNIRETTIPSIVSKAKKLVGNDSNPPILDDKGNTLAVWNRNMGGYRDINSGQEFSPENTQENEYDAQYKELSDFLKVPSPEEDPYLNLIKQMQGKSDQNTERELNAIKSEYQQLQDELKQQQQFGTGQLRGALGQLGGKYTPLRSIGFVQTKLTNDLKDIAALNSREQIDKNKILSAQADKDFELMGKQIDVLESRRKEKAAIAEKILDDISTTRKENQKRQIAVSIGEDVMPIIESGITDPIQIAKQLQLSGSKYTPKEIKETLDVFFPTGTGIIGEYQFYKRDAEARGINPLSFNEFQDMDANRKKSIAQAGIVAGSDLNSKETAIFNKMVEKYSASEAVKALDRAYKLQDIVNEVKKNPEDPANQLSLIYAFIKGLDTDSAVREGEIDLVKSIQSYSQKYKTEFERISNGKAVSKDTALNIANGAEKIIESIQNTAKKKRALYDAQAKVNGTNVNNAWNDFSTMYEESTSDLDNQLTTAKPAKDRIVEAGQSNPEIQKAVKQILIDNPNYSYEMVAQILNI